MTNELITKQPADIVYDFTPEEYSAYQKLKELMSKTAANELIGRYKIAQYIKQIYDNTKSTQSIYGKNFLERLAIAFGYKSAAVFREMINVVEAWPTEDQFENEVVKRLGIEASWKRTVFLARIDNVEKRDEIIKDLSEGKDIDDVRKIHNQPKTRTGRKPAQIETIDEYVKSIKRTCEPAIRQTERWLDFDIYDCIFKLKQLEPQEVLNVTKYELKECKELVQVLANNLNAVLTTIKDQLKSLS